MGHNERYVMQVEYDPSGMFSKGARIPYNEFLTGMRMNVYPVGMRITKVAPVSSFVVDMGEYGAPMLLDNNGASWYLNKSSNGTGIIKARREKRRREVGKAQNS